jgi:signal transduction histidine kinase/ligand-binding sensor domain-containing protein
MKFYTAIYIVLWGCLFDLAAQDNTSQFWHINSETGLSQNHVSCMLQDKEGFIWIGTFYGLNRFNGNDIKVFTKNNNPGSLSGNMIASLFEDKDGFIWVGTTGGLDKYDKRTDAFTKIVTAEGKNLSDNNIIRDILQDKSDNIWFSTLSRGVMKYNTKLKKLSVFNVANYRNISSNSILGLILIKDKLWVCSDSGVFFISLPGEKVVKPAFKGYGQIKYGFCITQDKLGNVWVGNQKGELFQIDPVSFFVKKITYLPSGPKNNQISISKLSCDNQNKIFIATQGAGLISYNILSGKTEQFTHNLYNKSSISSNEIFSLLIDKSNNVFAGSYGKGVSVYSYSMNKFKPHFLQVDFLNDAGLNSFTSCAEAANGHLVLGCYNGFYILDTLSWQYTHILPGSNYDENKILNIKRAPDGTFWMSTPKVIHRYSSDFKKIASYHFLKNNFDQIAYSLFFDSQKNLWIGYAKNLGAIKIPESEWKKNNTKEFKFTWFRSEPNNSNSLKNNMVWAINEDKNKTIWLGCDGYISRYNEKRNSFTNYKIIGLCKDIEFDSQNNLIIASQGSGVYLFNPGTERFLNYTEKEGLCSDFIMGSLVDEDGNVWLTSENGLSKFNTHKQTFRNYYTIDGLPSNCFEEKAAAKLSNGSFYLGTNNGFLIFNPENVKEDTIKSKIVLTGIRILNQPIVFSNNEKSIKKLIDTPVELIKEIRLNHKQRADFQFEFSTLNYSEPGEINYEYQLEGYDNSWIKCIDKHRMARYTNIPEGTYYFKIKSYNADGLSNSNVYSLKITVVPPFYKSALFLILLVLFIVGVTYLYYRFRLNTTEKQKRKLLKIVEERTAELSYKNQALEKKTNNLRKANALLRKHKISIEQQKEEIAEQRDALSQLNMMKDRFFSIIAHDLKNPFNIIMGFSTLLLNNSKKYDEARKEKIVSLLNQSAISAHLLLENLLSWSRSQSGNLLYEPETVLTGDIILQSETQVRDMARMKKIQIKIENNFENEVLWIDRNMINSVLRNLLSNAIKFSSENSEIIIRVDKTEKRGIFIHIIDFGTGMDPEFAQNLFINKGVGSHVGTAGEKGTGLGLVICKEFVEKHNGQISVKSLPGKGSTFSVFLPQNIV